MGWTRVGYITLGSDKSTKLYRDWLVSAVRFRDGSVELLAPTAPHPFKDFVALERWIAEACTRNGVEASSLETRFMEEVEDFIRSVGRYENLVLPAQTILEFTKSLSKLYKAGFQTNTSAKVIGMLVIDGATLYKHLPETGILFLEKVAYELNGTLQL